MKKHLTKLLLLPFVALTLLFSSCGPEVELKATYFTVYPGDWQTQDGLGYYYAECPFPEYGQRESLDGAVMVYFIDQNGYNNQLPYLLPYYLMGPEGTVGPFFENIRYDLSPGYITFIVQQNDNDVSLDSKPSVAMKFKVCVFHNN